MIQAIWYFLTVIVCLRRISNVIRPPIPLSFRTITFPGSVLFRSNQMIFFVCASVVVFGFLVLNICICISCGFKPSSKLLFWTDPIQFFWTDPTKFFRNVHICMTTHTCFCFSNCSEFICSLYAQEFTVVC